MGPNWISLSAYKTSVQDPFLVKFYDESMNMLEVTRVGSREEAADAIACHLRGLSEGSDLQSD